MKQSGVFILMVFCCAKIGSYKEIRGWRLEISQEENNIKISVFQMRSKVFQTVPNGVPGCSTQNLEHLNCIFNASVLINNIVTIRMIFRLKIGLKANDA